MDTKKTIILGVTGSVAAIKIPDLISLLKEYPYNIKIVATDAGMHFIDVRQLEKLTGNSVYHELFVRNDLSQKKAGREDMPHIQLAEEADLILICPATANFLAKAAVGLGDDVLSSLLLASSSPVILVPAMHSRMWLYPATQEHVMTIQKRGHRIIGPVKGALAGGDIGIGRMTDIHQIVDEVNAFFARKKKLLGKKIVITAGSTEESLDAVRIITNRASGKSGVFLAEEAYQLGADVTLIRGSHAVAPSLPVTDIVVKSSQDMKEALEKSLLDADVVIHTAAVADFYLPDPLKDKVKSSKQWNLTLVPTKKIVTTIKQINPHVFLVAYKAENGLSEPELIESANLLLKQTHADIVVANDIGRHDAGFGVDDNDVWIVTETSVKHVPFMHKRLLAQRLLDFIGNQFDIKSKQC